MRRQLCHRRPFAFPCNNSRRGLYSERCVCNPDCAVVASPSTRRCSKRFATHFPVSSPALCAPFFAMPAAKTLRQHWRLTNHLFIHEKGAPPMSVTDEVLQANQKYAATFDQGALPIPPARKLAVLACMDARLNVYQILGLKTGDAHIFRNAGGIATEDALRSLIISHHLLGTQEFIVINHTDCGMLTFSDHDLLHKLEEKTGVAAIAPVHFHTFKNLESNVKQQVARIKGHPYVRNVPVR